MKKKHRRKATWVENSGYDDPRNEKSGLGKTAMSTLVG